MQNFFCFTRLQWKLGAANFEDYCLQPGKGDITITGPQ